LALALGGAAAVLAGCGRSSHGTSGAAIYRASGCGTCHTLAAAKTQSSVGPDLDVVRPSYATVLRVVRHGSGEMPSYRGTLEPDVIRALATFVSKQAGTSP
jgi:mono/diheme cytochrome c family protein